MSTLVKGGRIGTWSSIWSAEMERLRGLWEQGVIRVPFPHGNNNGNATL